MTRKQFCKLATMMLLSYATVSVGAQEIVSVDGRIREVYYSGSGVVEIPTASGFSTTVEFADKETVQTVVSGDTVGWTVVPQGSRVLIGCANANSGLQKSPCACNYTPIKAQTSPTT